MANWNWTAVCLEAFRHWPSRSTCLNYLHRLGFVLKRPKKRLVKADEQKREAFVAEYATLSDEAWRTGAKIFFADEAHFRADAELRGKWVLKGGQALVDSYGEKASTTRSVPGDRSVRNLERLRQRHSQRDLGQRAGAEAVREYLRTPGLGLRLMNLPGYSPDFNADEAIWGWAREEATGNLCLGTKALVKERVGNFLCGLSIRKDEVKGRCRTVLQSIIRSVSTLCSRPACRCLTIT